MKAAGHDSSVADLAAPVAAGGLDEFEALQEHREMVATAYEGLARSLSYLTAAEQEGVERAFVFARRAHMGQFRSSGEPYITHPIEVALLCAQWHLDAAALSAALMHDAMEDCDVSKQDIENLFGSDIAELVDGLTKLEKLEFHSREENQAQSFRKMLLAMAKDVRVILIKLADRTHNMRTLSVVPRSKWGRISRETLEIYAPIANRLGLSATYRELRELAFKYLYPWRYRTLAKAVERVKERRRSMSERLRNELMAAFKEKNMKVRLIEREHELYRVYEQMKAKNLSLARVSDIFAIQALFENVMDCYTGLGVLHQTFRPVPGQFKDYIANSSLKGNGYQSIHTTLLGPSDVEVEVELRTEMMHVVAESGIAAHWMYRSKGLDRMLADNLNGRWLQSMLEIEHSSDDAADFLSDVKVDLHPESVYVFTPKNQILTLPRGATVVDFAYAIHSNVGDHIAAALVNGSPASLRSTLKNGDTVEIITAADANPQPGWLEFVKTGRARSKIRSQLKNMDQGLTEVLGLRLVTQALRVAGYPEVPPEAELATTLWKHLGVLHQGKSREQLLQDIGHGRLLASSLVAQVGQLLQDLGLRPDALALSKGRMVAGETVPVVLTIGGADSAPVRYSQCCWPIPGDLVDSNLVSGRGLEVHRRACPVGQRRREKEPESVVAVEWAEETEGEFETSLVLHLRNIKGALADACAVIAQCSVDIIRIEMLEQGRLEAIEMRINVGVHDLAHLEGLLKSLRKVRAVMAVERFMAG